MSAPRKLAAFAVAVAAALGLGFGLGRAVGPLADGDEGPPAHADHGMETSR